MKPVGQMPKQPTQPGQTFTQTSLAANVPVSEMIPIFVSVFVFILTFCLFVCLCVFIYNFLFVFIQKPVPPATPPKPNFRPITAKPCNTSPGVPSFISNNVISFANQERLRGGTISKVCLV